MTKQHALVAIEKGLKETANKVTAPLFHAAGDPSLFAGLTKTYEPVDEDGEQYPAESVRIRATVSEVLDAFQKANSRLLDVTASKENTNREAVADVVVDGVTLIEKAPVTFLMQFEKFLQQEVRGIVVKLPTLDPAQEWSLADAERKGVQVTPEIKRHKTKKVPRVITLAPPTDKHPAQVQLVNEDVLAGYWTEKKFSGAISASRKQELTERVESLIEAVKIAREKANDVEVKDLNVGADVFGYLFA
jgi:hypothetical protein